MSLADVYNVEGSIAGIERLESQEVSLVHEMGATLFSERVSFAIRRAATGAINENTTFEVLITNLPAGPWRLLNILVLSTGTPQVVHASVALRREETGREMPVFIWDTANNVASTILVEDSGGGAVERSVLIPDPNLLPSMGAGADQPQMVETLALRGLTSGFGAGTIAIVGLYLIAFSQVGGISSRGLPIPGW